MDTETLTFRPQSHISMPARIDLAGDMLHWGGGFSSEKYAEQFARRPVAGALRDFIALASAGPEDVLAFARARGVLGISPFVTRSWCPGDADAPGAREGSEYDFVEPVVAYTRLASHFAGIFRIMDALRKGQKVDGAAILSCLVGRWDEYIVENVRAASRHELLWEVVAECWILASIRLMPAYFDTASPPFGRGTPFDNFASYRPEISVVFGNWEDGERWDRESSRRSRPGGLIALPEDYTGLGTRDHSSGEWVKPYLDYATRDLYMPHDGSRPSALYNALVFQLMKEVSLEEDSYFCSQCSRLYTYDEEKAMSGGKIPPGKSPKEWGNSKPRSDRPTSFCSLECRRGYRTADKQRTRLEAKGKVATQEGSAARESASRPGYGMLSGTDVSGDNVNAPLGYRFVPRRPDVGPPQSPP